MSDEIASLVLAVDTNQVKTATVDLASLSAQGETTTKTFNDTNRTMNLVRDSLAGQEKASREAAGASKVLATEQAGLNGATAALTAGQVAYIEKIREEAAQIGMNISQKKAYQAAQLGLTDTLKTELDALEQVSAGHGKHTFSMNSSIAKMESMRVIHDAMIGSYTRMGSSLFVLGNATGVSTAILSAMAGPIGLLVIAAGAVAFGLYQATSETNKFNRALEQTGGYVGKTSGELIEMSKSIGAANHDISGTATAMEALVASGTVTSESIVGTTKAVVAFANMTGESIDKVVKEFARAQDGVLKFALEHNKHYHDIDVETYNVIHAKEKQGETEEALSVLMERIAKADNARIEEHRSHLVGLAKAWDDATNALKTYWSQFKETLSIEVGSASPETKLAARKKKNSTWLGRLDNAISDWDQNTDADTVEQGLQFQINEGKAASDKTNASSKATEQAGRKDAYLESGTYASKKEKRTLEIQKENAAFVIASKGFDVASNEYEAMLRKHEDNLAEIDKRAEGAKGRKPRDTQGAIVKGQIDTESQLMAVEKESVRDRNALYDLYHQHNRLSDEQYYKAKQALIVEQEQFDIESIGRKIKAEQQLHPKDAAAAEDQKNKIQSLQAAQSLERDHLNNLIQESKRKEEMLIPEKALSDLQKEAATLKKEEATRIALIQLQVKNYSTTAIDAQVQINALTKEYGAQIGAVADKMQVLASANPELKNGASAVEAARAEADKANEKTGATKSWEFAARESMQKYGEQAKQTGSEIGDAMTHAFKGAEDAFVQFASTGKSSFKSLATSILQDIERIFIRKAIAGIVNMAVGGFGGTPASGELAAPSGGGGFLSSLFGGGRAGGGPVQAGMEYWVGENGPEKLRMGPGGAGTVIPNNAPAGGAGNVQVNVAVNVDSGQTKTDTKGPTDGREMQRLGEMIGDRVRQVLVQEKRNGGLLA